jgi:glutamine synthetase
MIRIPGPGRIETRIVDGAANPYLATAMILAAGLDGIRKKTDPGAANSSNLYEVPESELRARQIGVLPTNLSDALDAFEQDQTLVDAMGREYAAYYVNVKREEWNRYHHTVSQWERDQYLSIY